MIINGIGELKGTITAPACLTGKISGNSNNLGGVITFSDGITTYSGDYTITPRVQSQTMNTKNKKMEDNVTVLAIPYYETSNLKGKTVYIGGE